MVRVADGGVKDTDYTNEITEVMKAMNPIPLMQATKPLVLEQTTTLGGATRNLDNRRGRP